MYSELYHDGLESLRRVFIGSGYAIIIGVILGLGRSCLPKPIKYNFLFKFIFDFIKFPPPIAWIPLVVLYFGIGEKSAYVIVFIGAFSPVFTNTYEGAESMPNVLKTTSYNFGVKRFRYIYKVLFPYTLPYVFTGIRSGLSMGWMSVIAAEMVSGQSGLGYKIQLLRLNLDYQKIFIYILFIGILGYFLFQIVGILERLILPWSERIRKQKGLIK